MRRAARVDGNHRELVRFARSLGALVETIPGDSHSPGRPDLLVGFRGRLHLWEVKAAKGRLSPEQLEWRARWASRGIEHEVIRTREDVLASLGLRVRVG